MFRTLLGIVVCVIAGAAVELLGLARHLPIADSIVPPAIPTSLAPMPSGGRIRVTLVPSEATVSAISSGLSASEVAHYRIGGVALVDGRVFAVSTASVRGLLRALSWDGLPIEVKQLKRTGLQRFSAPEPASIAWMAQKRAFLSLGAARQFWMRYPNFMMVALGSALLLMLHTLLTGAAPIRPKKFTVPGRGWRANPEQEPVRVVLVADSETLAQVRTAIGEEHIVAATANAFAFADGWVLAVREGSVFELVSRLGWQARSLQLASRSEFMDAGRPIPSVSHDTSSDTLGLLEALHVCGPLAHDAQPC